MSEPVTLTSLLETAKPKFDLTDPADQASLYTLTEGLMGIEVPKFTREILLRDDDTPLEFKLGAKLVESRRAILDVHRPLKVGIVFAMWGEQNRLHPRSEDNPNGEDSLRTKLTQLAWITKDTTVDWHVYAVDDGCPHGSGDIAQEIADSHPLGDKVTVLKLAEAVPTDSGPLKNLASADDSRKGGAIILGCMQAVEDGVDAVIYTDADNSVHLGQIGLLLKPYSAEHARVILGNRKDPDAILVKQEARWGVGIALLRHMQRMVGEAIFSQIKDTQAAFKLYDADVLSGIIAEPSVFDFSFDTDWLLALIAADESYEAVPFAFIDSFAESASIVQGPMTTWETLLKGLVSAVRARNVPHNEAMAQVIDEEIQSSADLDLLINHIPPQLDGIAASDYGDPSIMSPAEVQAWIQERKREAVAA